MSEHFWLLRDLTLYAFVVRSSGTHVCILGSSSCSTRIKRLLRACLALKGSECIHCDVFTVGSPNNAWLSLEDWELSVCTSRFGSPSCRGGREVGGAWGRISWEFFSLLDIYLHCCTHVGSGSRICVWYGRMPRLKSCLQATSGLVPAPTLQMEGVCFAECTHCEEPWWKSASLLLKKLFSCGMKVKCLHLMVQAQRSRKFWSWGCRWVEKRQILLNESCLLVVMHMERQVRQFFENKTEIGNHTFCRLFLCTLRAVVDYVTQLPQLDPMKSLDGRLREYPILSFS